MRLCERATHRMRTRGLRAKTIGLKVRFADFSNLTRSKTLPLPIHGTHEVYEVARELHRVAGIDGTRIRLLGISLENLVDETGAASQLELGERDKGWREVQGAIDRAISRFGRGSVTPARLVDEVESEDPEPSQSD